MDNDELLTRILLSAMGAVVAWLAWVLTALTSVRSAATSASLGIAATLVVYLILRTLRANTRLTDSGALVRAMATFVAFGVVAIVLSASDAPDLIVRVAVTAGQVGCGLFLAFRTRAVVGGIGIAAALSAIGTPFYGALLFAVGLTAYLERKPPAFLT
ncbi:MAG: hypothetical protein ACN4GZ_09060 [Acidimicrobiales bacterium]